MPRRKPRRPPRGKTQRLPKQMVSLKPPQLNTSAPYRHTYRFMNTAFAANVTVTASDLLGAAGTFAKTTNSIVTTWYTSFKIHRVRIWALTSNAGNTGTATVQLTWSGTVAQPADKGINDISINPSVPAFIDSKPPAGSSPSFWNGQSSSSVFVISTNTDIIVDVDMSLQNFGGFDSLDISVATAVLGEPYWLALDGASTNVLVPVGLQTTH